jgi:hypothetical protein
MDWLTFIASITKSLAWPLVVAWIVFLLRRPLRQVVRSLIRFRYKDLEIDFGRDLEALEREVETARLPIPTEARERSALPAPADQLEAIAEVSPRAAVREAWLLVEHEVLRAAERLGIDTAQPLPRLTLALAARDAVGAVVHGMIVELRRLRNAAVHTAELALSPKEALEYVHLARRVAAALRDIPSGGS